MDFRQTNARPLRAAVFFWTARSSPARPSRPNRKVNGLVVLATHFEPGTPTAVSEQLIVSKSISMLTSKRQRSARRRRPLFRSARGQSGELPETVVQCVDIYRVIRRRAREAGFDADICCHAFRATAITAYLENGGTLWRVLRQRTALMGQGCSVLT